MIEWKNLDQLASYEKLLELEDEVALKEVMAGANGAKRVAEYFVPMSSDMVYNYAAKQVDDKVLDTLASLADEASLVDKYKALLSGEVINTGEKRMVLHQLTRGQQATEVVADQSFLRQPFIQCLSENGS